MNENPAYILRIAVTLPVQETYSYYAPLNLVSSAQIGCRVMVPFRNQKVIGYILDNELADPGEDLKYIIEVLDASPLFPRSLVPFFIWMADYYMYPIGRLIQSALPTGLNIDTFKSGQVTDKGLRAIEKGKPSSNEKKLLCWIKENAGKKLPSPMPSFYQLQKKGWIEIHTRDKKRSVGPLKKKFIKIRDRIRLEEIIKRQKGSFKAKNEHEFLHTILKSDNTSLMELSERFSNGRYLVNKWIKTGLIESYDAPIVRNLKGDILATFPVPPSLYKQQKEAVDEIKKRIEKEKFSVCFLYGVTGSGKTEVYYQAILTTLKRGRQAILMVPEIALASYMEGIFRYRLGEKVAILHSSISSRERYEQWMKISSGQISLVIGARSALFSPLPDLGLIIVDEEYDPSYKQEERPNYQARDAAVVRAKMENSLALLGAGTPSIQSYYNTVKGRYHLILMPERIEKRPLPDIEVVDMKNVHETIKKDSVLSPKLRDAIKHNLEKGRQTILFLNRRGFSRVFLCRSCGESIRCKNCDLSLTFHLKKNILACHYCGYYTAPHDHCQACGNKEMRAYGFGTERLEQELGELFPLAKIARMDRDSARHKGQTTEILRRFRHKDLDILVGTQMIAKGYDFPNVTLVGVVAADLSLGFPDFRAGERTFQLLSQVAGRAGRGEQRGRVIVQTFNPAHYAIEAARNHEFGLFFQKEIELREQLGYPPFSYLACLRLRGNNQRDTAFMAQKVGVEIRRLIKKWPRRGNKIKILGPAEAPFPKLKGKYRWQVLIKSEGTELLHYLLREVEAISKKLLRNSGVAMYIDVDPYQML